MRSEIATATTDGERKAKRGEVATAARRALLLDHAISAVLKSENPNDPGPLSAVLASVHGTVAGIRAKETSEEKTRKELGDQTALLGEQKLANAGNYEDAAGSAAPVQPEEAMPEATAAATDVMVGSLAGHVESQQRVLSHEAAVAANVVPSGNSIEDLKLAFNRYYAFVSPQAATEDPMAQYGTDWYERIYEVYGHMGLEGGAGRALLTHTAEDLVANSIAQPTTQFSSEIRTTRRRTEVSGTAGAVGYDTAELFDEGRDPGVGEGAEAQSRQKYAAEESQHQAEQFAKAKQDSDAGDNVAMHLDVGITDGAAFYPVRAEDDVKGTWNYLIRAENPLTGQKVAEQKQMPMEVANLILARSQALAALRGTHDTNKLGEAGTRSGGVEGATGTVRARYEQGQEPDAATHHPGLAPVEAAKAKVAQSSSAGKGGMSATQSVLDDLEAYLDQWFANAHGMVPRIAGILAIANREYKVAEEIAAEITPAKLAIAVAKAMAIAAAIRAAGMFGPIGRAIGEAAGVVMHHLGPSDPAIVLTIAGWLHAARRRGEPQERQSAGVHLEEHRRRHDPALHERVRQPRCRGHECAGGTPS